MAEEHQIEARILLRYDTYSNWMNSTTILKKGEAAIAAFLYQNTITNSDVIPDHTPPAIGMKIGDGYSTFNELPWVQGIAADVYSWAKQQTKPVYNAQEIMGLQNYIENLIGETDIEVTIAPRIYSLVKGVNENSDKYYLRYKENNEDSPWIVDTSQAIDLTDLTSIINWITREDINTYGSLGDRTEEHIQYDLNKLNLNDMETDSSVVTSVSQTRGKISINKRQLSFNDLSGSIDVTQGGTGLTSIPEGSVLVGNGTSNIQTVPIDDELTATQHLVYSYVIKAYIDKMTAGLTGAMHFIGEAGIVITNNSSVDPQISGYIFSQAQPGDVILGTNKEEYVWTGSSWRLLGDEGSYVIKGSITDADISDNAQININKIFNLSNLLDTKVDKIDGKSLSSNDFTDEDKQKLSGIQDNAQRNLIEHIYINDTEIKPTKVNDDENSISFRMSSLTELEAEQLRQTYEKVQTIENGAQVNTIQGITINGESVMPTSEKIVDIVIPDHKEHINVIEGIKLNNKLLTPDQDKQVNIVIDENAVTFNIITGARVPNGLQQGQYENVQINNNKQLELARIAATGRIYDIQNTTAADAADYLILNCGNADTLIN